VDEAEDDESKKNWIKIHFSIHNIFLRRWFLSRKIGFQCECWLSWRFVSCWSLSFCPLNFIWFHHIDVISWPYSCWLYNNEFRFFCVNIWNSSIISHKIPKRSIQDYNKYQWSYSQTKHVIRMHVGFERSRNCRGKKNMWILSIRYGQ
jgi:hypothetical protein